jgi:polysaccharide export outer membrane protein
MTRRLFGRTRLSTIGIAAALVLAVGPHSEGQDRPAANGTSVSPDSYRIGPEDMLQIAVWKNEALSKLVPVRPDGMISLPLLHDVKAAGLTPMELRDILVRKLAEFMPAAEVSVIVTDVRSFKVSVIGEVHKPARYELKSGATVLDVLALAGGFNEFAARNRIVVLRHDGKAMRRVPFNYSKVIAAGGESENFYLQSGDIVLVP